MKKKIIAFGLLGMSTSAYADVIFPAFAGPYVSMLFFPVAAAAILLSEAAIYKILSSKSSIPAVLLLVVTANVLSSVVGVVITAVLPSGLVEGPQGGIVGGPDFSLYFKLSFVLAYLLSILIEGTILKLGSGKFSIDRPYLLSLVANTASYVLLVAIVWWEM